MTPSEKHMETAKQVYADSPVKVIGELEAGALVRHIARALAQAERDGMKRAAAYHEDLAAQHEAALTDGDTEGNAWHLAQSVAHRRHAAAILSEAGEE